MRPTRVPAIVIAVSIAVAPLWYVAVRAAMPSETAAAPAANLHWGPAEDLEAIDVGLIDGAKRQIDMAAYVLTDRAVIAALQRAAGRGVAVRPLPDPGQLEHEPALADLRATPGISARVKRGHVLMHLKSYAIDGVVLRTGSANFSASGLKHQDNELLVTRDGAAVARFETIYAGLYDRAE